MKTIFYKTTKDENADYWFENVPAKEWFTLENTLYEPNGNIKKRTIIPNGDRKIIHDIVVHQTQDTFSDDGIIRRIALNVIGS
jgi:hypothetical protein